MSNKVFSVSIDGNFMTGLVSPVQYRIHTSDARISPKGSECVLWNEVWKLTLFIILYIYVCLGKIQMKVEMCKYS